MQIADPLVSIIMPAYNAEQYISQSIISVQCQTYTKWELIIVDDGSIDKTSKIIHEFSQKDSRIIYIYQPNSKQGKARNNGLKNSKGKYIAFLDADDLWLPDKLTQQIQFIESKDVDLTYGNTYVFENDFILPADQLDIPANFVYDKLNFTQFLSGNRIPILTALGKKNIFFEVGLFTEKLEIQNAEDYHMWTKIALYGYKIQGIPNYLSAYRLSNTSVSTKDRANSLQVVEALLDLMENNPDKKEIIYPYLINWIKRSLYHLPKFSHALYNLYFDKYLSLHKRSKILKAPLSSLKYLLGRKISHKVLCFIYYKI